MMNEKFKTLLMCVIFVLTMGACGEDEPEPGDSGDQINVSDVTKGELRAKINEKTKSAEFASASASSEGFSFIIDFPDGGQLSIYVDQLRETSYTLTAYSMSNYARFIEDKEAEDPNVYASNTGQGEDGHFKIIEVNEENETFSGSFDLALYNENDQTDSLVIPTAAFNAIPFSVIEDSPGLYTATVNGEAWAAESVTVKVVGQVNVIDIQGKTADDIDVSISMPDDIAPGTYQLTGNGDYIAVIYPAGEDIGTHFSSSGELTIVSHDRENYDIEGAFYFEATRDGDPTIFSVVDGEFSYEDYY